MPYFTQPLESIVLFLLAFLIAVTAWYIASRIFRKNEWFRLQSAALEVCANAIAIADVAGVIQWVNPAFCKLSGYTPKELIGSKPHEFFKSGLQENDYHEVMWQTLLSGRYWRGELVNRRKDNTVYNEEMTVTPVANAQGEITHFIIVKQDITAHKQVEATAQAASHTKSKFLANMSHEIRTPMNGIIGMVDILQRSECDSMQHRMLDTIQKSSLNLLNILNDILDFSKIEAGKLSIEHLPTHLRELAEGVAQLMVATTAANKSIALSVFVSPALPHWIISDPTRLRQVLLNLMGNAVKFSTNHTDQLAQVMLYVEPCALANNQPGIKLCITDNGIGMSPDVQKKLFQPFTQADESTARKFGGTGLGLSISKHLITLLGGEISVRSAAGEGAEFSIKLPLQVAPPVLMPVYGPTLEGLQVVTLIHDPLLARIVSAYCHDANAEVTQLDDLDALQQHLNNMAPDMNPIVLLLSAELTEVITLPERVGIVRLVRSNERSETDAITACSSPLIYSDLMRAIGMASGRLALKNPTRRALNGPLQAPVAPTVEQALADQQLILLADDNETNRDVMQEQLRLLGYACELAEDGVVALAMWQSGRYALLLTDCHMPNMDGYALTAEIRRLEPEGVHFPIVAITANAMQGQAERCKALGMDDYLSKPLRMIALAPMLQHWLPLTAKQTVPQEALASTLPPALVDWDAATLGHMVGDNHAMQRRLLDKFLVNAEKQVAAIVQATGISELNMAADLAHSLKSSSRMIGALRLGGLSEALETAGIDGDEAHFGQLVSGLEAVFFIAKEKIKHHIHCE